MLLFIFPPQTLRDLKAENVEAAEGNIFFHKRSDSLVKHRNSAGFREGREFYGWALKELCSPSGKESHDFYVCVSECI